MSEQQHTHTETRDAVIIGAGFAGIYLIHQLRDRLGLDVVVFERGSDVGGTWYWNRYPGARCDFESEFYSYSFDESIQQEWEWSERYAAQPEILAYLSFVADRLDVRRSVRFDTTVTEAEFDASTDTWTVRTDCGDVVRARFVIAATGPLSVPSNPRFEGMDTFAGTILHTGDWPHEPVDFTGKRVAVIGTGSSGIQAIPLIAAEAEHVTVLQRTATFTVPAANRPLTDLERRATKRSYAELREIARGTRAGVLLEMPIGALASVDPALLRAELERRWRHTGLGLLSTLSDSSTSLEANETIGQFVRDKINEIVADAETAALLEPHDYPIGTKRIALDTGFYETFNRGNVRLVSLRQTPIERFSPAGIVVGGEELAVDVIVLATGFDAMTGALRRIDIRGLDGRTLAEEWEHGPTALLGVAVHGFPNLFVVNGPGSPAVLSNMVTFMEQQIDWIADHLAYAREQDITRVQADAQAQAEWDAHVAQLAAHTLYPRAASWYMGANIPGKPRVFMVYLGGCAAYRAKCDAVAAAGYTGFEHTRAGSALVGTTYEVAE